MASKKSRIEVEIVAEDNASDEIKQVASQAQKLDGESVDVSIDADVSKVLSSFDEVAAQAKATAAAADVLSKALGPELAAKADTTAIVNDLKQMGLSLDQITNNADQLGNKLRSLSDADVGGKLGSSLGTARGKLDGLSQSAQSSRSALANMVGNSAQDLGQVAGIAGSTGVAVGQMAEYFSDAALAGEGMTSALKNMATVAGPIAVLALVVNAVSSVMQEQARRTEEATQRTEELGKAMAGAGDDALGLSDSLRTNISDLEDFEATSLLGAAGAEGFFNALNDGLKSVPLIGGLLSQDLQVNLIDVLNNAGISIYAFTSAITGGTAARKEFLDNLNAQWQMGKITEDQYVALIQAFEQYWDAQAGADAQQKLLNIDVKEGNALLDELALKADPLSHFTDQWKILFNDMADGVINTQAAADAVNFLADSLGITQEEVIKLAKEHLADDMKKAADETKRLADESKKAAEAQNELSQRVGETNLSLRDLVGNLDDIEVGALAKALDPGDAALDALSALQDLNKEARDFGDWLHEPETKVKGLGKDLAAAQKDLAAIDPNDTKEVAKELSKIRDIQEEILEARKKVTGTPNIFDLGDPKSADFLRKFAPIRDDASKGLEDAFAQGGMEGAKKFADNMIRTLSQETGLRPEEIMGLLGWQDLSVTLKVAIELSDVEKAKEQLGFLENLLGPSATQKDRAQIFNIRMGLSTGAITGKEAEAAIQQMMLQVPDVQLPVELLLPDFQELLRSYQAKMDANPLKISVVLDQADLETDRETRRLGVVVPSSAGGTVNNNTIIYPSGVTPVAANGAIGVFNSRNGVRVSP